MWVVWGRVVTCRMSVTPTSCVSRVGGCEMCYLRGGTVRVLDQCMLRSRELKHMNASNMNLLEPVAIANGGSGPGEP